MPGNEVIRGQPRVVLDTNAVLDWLVFRDPGMRVWSQAIEQGRLHWVACEAMRHELQQTLGRAQLARWEPDAARVLADFDSHAKVCRAPSSTQAPGLICTDPDDQVFVDVSLSEGARWLVTHDRALLRLARAARRSGLEVLKPAAGQVALAAA